MSIDRLHLASIKGRYDKGESDYRTSFQLIKSLLRVAELPVSLQLQATNFARSILADSYNSTWERQASDLLPHLVASLANR